ncbi:APC family permease [Nocardioides marmotae]|uniref:Amino acid permease n=1 Tax=Nocardioides marmotae TaxID=2663857 RepID=A0A6I3JBW4_9ACTN|nr:APC family permease [Nocardioides marmotae]MCR6031931.1 amino acid permease [Gordonia jinghuaiqii]MBC9732128.1 APC family permease [Nocardioides marmotae]MTB83249.1 amino acid permease [Nocardioides marmotae]MTB95571.1 amino acid permease [Nocardioides marmotae]QKE00992.1 APC family permease [Nocardioides marmotae]
MNAEATVDETTSEPGGEQLKRVMGPKLLLFFIIGDIIGAGIFAITGDVASEVGGVAWLPFLVAFAVASLTALSYLELVTKHPQAAGAALFVHKAFGLHFVTFLVAFAVVCSGITSASTSSSLVASNLLAGLDDVFGGVPTGTTATLVAALGFMVLLALINLRGVGESVKFNVVLTSVVVLALGIIIAIGFWAMATDGDLGRVVVFESSGEKNAFVSITIATTVAFFAMVGFEDSVNMVEETKDPGRTFPRIMLTGLGICAVLYMLVAVAVVVVIPPGDIADPVNPDAGILLDVVRVGAPGIPIDTIFPFLTVFAVANTALINMLMASRLVYGMAKQDVLPRSLAAVLPGRRSPWAAIIFTTVMALGLITYVRLRSESDVVVALAGTTGLLLLCVFTVVNICCLVLRRDRDTEPVFRAPRWAPWVGAVASAFLVGPWARNEDDYVQYSIAGVLILIGVVLWVLTWMTNRGIRAKKTGFREIEHLEE